MARINELTVGWMTGVVNEQKSPNRFLQDLLFSNRITLPTESVDIDTLVAGRDTAPFVKKNGEAILVDKLSDDKQTIEAPNIRIKMAFTAAERMFRRHAGEVIYPSAAKIKSEGNRYMRRHLARMGDLATNSEEHLVSMAIQGTIAYAVDPQAAFQITYAKPAAHTIILTTFWDDADPTTVDIHANLMLVKRLINTAVSLNATDAILGEAATDVFLALVENKKTLLDKRRFFEGSISTEAKFAQSGAMFLGVFDGIRFWSYPRQVIVNGVATDLIRTKYAEFVVADRAAENVTYYGAIPDEDALDGDNFVGQRFSKQWKIKDPSLRIALLHTRPLPVPRRPGSLVSMKVVSG